MIYRRGTSPTKTDAFREQVEYSTQLKEKLATARTEGAAAVRSAEDDLGRIADPEAGVVIDVFLSCRATSSWRV
jgi:hypothetical protein